MKNFLVEFWSKFDNDIIVDVNTKAFETLEFDDSFLILITNQILLSGMTLLFCCLLTSPLNDLKKNRFMLTIILLMSYMKKFKNNLYSLKLDMGSIFVVEKYIYILNLIN